jgi:uncharacterized protein YqgC (DUF456 family)
MPWLWYLCLIALQFTGLFLTIVGLPGLWLMVATLVGYAWITTMGHYVGWTTLIVIFGLALIAEVLEFYVGSAGAKKAGASRRGMLGALVGALVGGFLFTIPVPVLGTIFGVCFGAFVGAALVEMGVVGNATHAGRVGWGAAKGRFFGIVLKLCFGLLMLLYTLIAALPIHGK